MKTCTKCKELKSLDSFNKYPRTADGRFMTCRICVNAAWRARHKINPEKHREHAKRYQRDNWGERKKYHAEWCKKNKTKANEFTARRAAALRQATPPWLTKDQRLEIAWFYETARDLQWLSEEPLCVDHIHAIRGDTFSGLHVPWNLQIISLAANSRKGNKLELR